MLAALGFRQFVREGRLTIVDANGKRHVFEGSPGPEATIRLVDPSLHHRLFFSPQMAVGEGYMNGGLVLEDGTDLYTFLHVCMLNVARSETESIQWMLRWFRNARAAFRHWNPIGAAQRKVSHHYDLRDELFDLFLDSDRQYSCGYFLDPSDDLETAQFNKKVHLAAKLRAKPGHKVLDIGSGWGGLGLFLADRHSSISVDGVTLSTEQHRVSNRRAEQAGVADRVKFHLRDYRTLEDKYDRIVSVGMLEHVGPRHYGEYYGKVSSLLKPDGVAVIHSIGVFRPAQPQNPWMEKYIFPGAYTPSLSQQTEAIERHTDLYVTDIEILRSHYADTLLAWRLNCAANRDKIVAMYDERFYRMWEFYLTGCELAFRYGYLMVFQIQLAKSIDAVPETRDYIGAFESQHLKRAARRLQQAGD
ncbi:cyclopropane-fatty-acyl-phospholipid synthase [Thalassobaculum fulvum]|uniref:Cyclopropane-fatty-acyl-phospholipid synthase n=1 Tax=Thalassobaculum fulvum TaxID=1633335 RepID=A0A918XWP0_9PROT|nr:cyclopropane-fatty-acyl-phospholipid synthase family protein [Thalassobaculum fulvum]GHD58678.1 cyclopropane-fatty-acyl-phospholipid synthase [Thalassobaculum fulvum]